MSFIFQKLAIPEVVLIKPKILRDKRGFFIETYKELDFTNAGVNIRFLQDNHSSSSKNTLRGLHYQKNPSAQGKLIRCVRGEIYDVAVDIRKGSPTYGKWIFADLSEENAHMLYIPPGFAHGFFAKCDMTEIVYKCSAEYDSKNDKGIIWNDPIININWPTLSPILSDKDKGNPTLECADNNFEYK
ncbi:MAG: dTDP-4-dehydrorhamnose 3,5-epimerase [Pseudomonadota bacterium]